MMKEKISNILEMLEDISQDSYEYISRELEFSPKCELWMNSNKSAFKTKKAIKLNDKMLKIYLNSNQNIYFLYEENASKFSTQPQNSIVLKNGIQYKVSFKYKVIGEIDAKLCIIGYSDSKKINEYIIDDKTDKYIEFNNMCNGYRLAIRLKGEGIFELENITMEPIRKDVKYTTRIHSVERKERSITSTKNINMISILDEFSYQNFSEECNVFNVTPDDYMQIINENDIDLLLIESAWKGKDGSWEHKIAKYNNQDKSSLIELIDYCRYMNIPTVFWNKEDPIHFEKFIDTAKLCDYIFTTDRNKVDDYKAAVGHDNVFSMTFAAQPKIHNPVKKYAREKGVVFAGSYYGNRHEDRKKDMHDILDICKNYNLAIFDRNYESTKNNKNSPFRYPEKYQENVKGSLKYTEIDKAYKGFEVMLNVNSVKYSPTMFSRRVFEGLACGTPIISTYSQGISEYFKDIVLLDEDNKKLESKLDIIFKDRNKRKEISILGIREVLSKHTYEHRLHDIMNKLGKSIDLEIPKVSFIVMANSREDVKKSIEIFESMDYENKKLVILMESLFEGYIECINQFNKDDINCYIYEYVINNYESIKKLTNSDYCCYIKLSNLYGENYVKDLVLANTYVTADIIGKSSYYAYKKGLNLINKDNEYIYVDDVKSDRCIISTNKLNEYDIKLSMDYLKGIKSLNELFKQGITIFSIDNYNFIENGKQNKLNKHLFK